MRDGSGDASHGSRGPVERRPSSSAAAPGGTVALDPATDDRDDVNAALKGDGDAYARIVGRHQARLARLLSRFVAGGRTLDELVQEAFVEAYFALGSWRGDAPLGPWLESIAVRVGYRCLRAKYRDERIRQAAAMVASIGGRASARTGVREGPDAAHAAQETEQLQVLKRTLESLRPRDRLVLTLLHLEERSVREVAFMTGWSESLVKVQAHRARKRLRTLMEHQEPGKPGGDTTHEAE